jgi:16S rRNA G966 N2-methylase RsmD
MSFVKNLLPVTCHPLLIRGANMARLSTVKPVDISLIDEIIGMYEISENDDVEKIRDFIEKTMAQRNRTICISSDEMSLYRDRLIKLSGNVTSQEIENRTISQDIFTILDWLPESFVDLLFIDPPYNLTKSLFN